MRKRGGTALKTNRNKHYYESIASNLRAKREKNPDFQITPDVFLSPRNRMLEILPDLIQEGTKVLELAAGIGRNTKYLLDLPIQLTVLDFSATSLDVLKSLYSSPRLVDVKVEDMTRTSFEDSSFDVIIVINSLAYARPVEVDFEIRRILKRGGYLIIIDSLFNAPHYTLNRLRHVVAGHRTLSTILNTPSMKRINSWRSDFECLSLDFFGSTFFLKPILTRFMGSIRYASLEKRIDSAIPLKRFFAFKFLYVGKYMGGKIDTT